MALEEFVRCKDERQYAQHSDDMASGTADSIEALRKMLAPASGAAAGGEEGEVAEKPMLGLVQDLTSLNRHVFN